MATHREQREADADGADFGFRRVGASEKQGLVRDVFERVAGRYDLMNDLMSLGVHRLWKSAMIDALAPRAGQTILDVAGGTGDIARRILDRAKVQADPTRVIVVDLSPAMLRTGRDLAIDLGRLTGIEWIAGDAERLPLSDRSVDAYAIAFGLRNVTCIDRALAEARRVLRPGGRFVCLEFSRVNLPALAPIYDVYSFRLIPALGEAVTGDRDAYRYLVESIRRFPAQDELAAMIEAAGLDRVRVRNLSGGIAALHSAWKI